MIVRVECESIELLKGVIVEILKVRNFIKVFCVMGMYQTLCLYYNKHNL